tara:strand:+ start:200 stop:529 length:330 start_codon:yes stop_codon:yes gene_type:complete
VTVADLLPPSPVQVRVKFIFPTAEIVTDSDPDVALDPDQAPEAEHEEALDDDQVNVDSEPIITLVGFAEKLTLGAGAVGVVGVDPPPPPPPPQEAIITNGKRILNTNLF